LTVEGLPVRSLLDVNVLIALLDRDHVSHVSAMSWLGKHGQDGWASCPITQNGCIRIMSNPAYPNSLPVHAVVERLAEACAERVHEFWPDDLSVLDGDVLDPARIHGPRQLTDLYLLAMAVAHRGRLVTFDTTIPLDAAKGARAPHLLVL
jgi:hypothetical protein